MAKVYTFTDGLNHLPSGILTTLHTLCGVCDDPENEQESFLFEGPITCDACRETARVVFDHCKKSEVK